MTSKMFYVEHGVPGGDLVEFEYEVEVDVYEPFVPAQTSGPPERWYPAEGGYVEMCSDIQRRRTDDKDAKWERVPYSVFLDGIALSRDFRDDQSDKPYRKTAIENAEAYVQEEMYKHCEEEARAAHEDAMEAKGDMIREEGYRRW